ncbi:MAG: tyrosine-type recombinase/integrase [Chitinophagaceae bacterium]|nr:tyrosine-type recombinase/integrase [Chitinophagaceae bacterium]
MDPISDFIAYLQHEKRYSIHTVQAYESDLEQFFLFLQSTFEVSDPAKVNHAQIRSWLAGLKESGVSARSMNRKISSLKSFFKYLLKMKIVDATPMSKVISPKNSKRLPVFVNETNMDVLFTQVEFPDDYQGHTERLILELLYQTGMRRAELLNLKLQDIDYSLRSIKVLGKGNKERIIPMAVELAQLIETYAILRNQQDNIQTDHLLLLPDGKPLYPKYVYLTVKKYLSQTTTLDKRSPHVLRHTFATHLLNKGADLNAVKELLGHANLTATQVYTHNTIEKLKDIHKKAHPKA